MYYSTALLYCLLVPKENSIRGKRSREGMVEVGAARKTEENVKVEDRWAQSSALNRVDGLAVK